MNGEIFENSNTNNDSDLMLSSVELSSSDGSIDSFFMPSTPKAKHIFADARLSSERQH